MNQYDWYEVKYKIPGIHKKPQVMTAQYLGTSGRGPMREYVFNLRPLAGTSSLRVDYIDEIKHLGTKAKAKLPKAAVA